MTEHDLSIEQLAKIDDAPSVSYGTEPVTVDAMLAEAGGGGWAAGVPDYEVHCLTACAWRVPGQSFRTGTLTILRPVPRARFDEEFRSGVMSDRFEPYATHRFDLLFEENSDEKSARAIAVKTHGPVDADPEFAAWAAARQQPVTVGLKDGGVLTLDRKYHWFAGRVAWGEREIDLSVDADEDDDVGDRLDFAESLLADRPRWEARVHEAIVTELLETANEWLADAVENLRDEVAAEGGVFDPDAYETELDGATFVDRIVLRSLDVGRFDRFTFWFEDGGIFAGHAIEVRCERPDDIFEVTIAG